MNYETVKFTASVSFHAVLLRDVAVTKILFCISLNSC